MAEVDALRIRGRALLAALIPSQRGDPEIDAGIDSGIDPAAVRADDDLIEALRLGRPLPDPDDPLASLLSAWRAHP